ncbi:cobalamin B12-binding domain-containing protein [Novipirellula rosea]|uniref:B12-binding domain-containing protein n=1 Tax=Novipirellula rosea TaxID=1031540 RepID=A0ABP8N3M4_9BACT
MNVSQAVAEMLDVRTEAFSEQLVERYFELHPELNRKFGERGKVKCREDARYHLNYLISAMRTGKPTLFLDYAQWTQQLLVNVGLPFDELRRYLAQLRTLLLEQFHQQEERDSITSFLDPAISAVGHRPLPQASHLEGGSETDRLAATYLQTLLDGDRTSAVELVTNAVDDGMPIKTVYLGIFQPVQYEIGRLWHLGELTVAQEHFCTAVTQWVMSRLYPMVFTHSGRDKRLVAACVSGDLHEIGLRMVADLLELDGWNTCYLGANVPIRGIVETVTKERAQILALSATMGFHLGPLTQVIELLREDPALANVKILVGGRPFLIEPSLVQAINADAMASNAEEAISIANDLLG